jgi:apolipoprotein N-acyltransferase
VKSKSFHLAYRSFEKKNLEGYSITSNIIKAFFTALLLSAFIYLDYFGFHSQILCSLFALAGFWMLLGQGRSEAFWTGFFVGVLWFYWIALSFRYYGDTTWLIPFIIALIAGCYGLFFLIPSLITQNPYMRALLLLILSQIAPFGFNWFDWGAILYYTPFGLSAVQVGFLWLSMLLVQNARGKYFVSYLIIAAAFFAASIDYSHAKPPAPLPFDVEVAQTQIPQEDKWSTENLIPSIKANFALIEDAIERGERLIILPETAFATYLNKNEALLERLGEYSQHIAIITGGLAYDEGRYFNSSYLFDHGNMTRADKVALVPFAEKVPAPRFIAKIINDLFFEGASDFEEAPAPTDYTIDGVKLRSAVCFEGSVSQIHQGNPNAIAVISNNAWFTPSTEPTLQTLMLSLYATRSNSIIYHSVNGKGGGILMPRRNWTMMIWG